MWGHNDANFVMIQIHALVGLRNGWPSLEI